MLHITDDILALIYYVYTTYVLWCYTQAHIVHGTVSPATMASKSIFKELFSWVNVNQWTNENNVKR